MDIKFAQEDFDLFQKRIEQKRKNSFGSMWIIKVNGEVYVTSSGKCGWKQKGHAKSAFKLDSYHIVGTLEEKYGYKTYKDSLKLWNDYLSELENKGIVEFIEVC